MTKVSKNSTDPRAVRTRRMLREALFTLLDEKHFEAITVLEIAERAGLNPATLYLHYQDKWELLNSVVAELSAIVDAHPHAAFTTETSEHGEANQLERQLFEHIGHYRNFYRLMLGKNGVASVRHALQAEFQRVVREVLVHVPVPQQALDIPVELVEHYIAGSYVAVVEWWVTLREPIPVGQLAHWLESLWQITSDRAFLALFAHSEIGGTATAE